VATRPSKRVIVVCQAGHVFRAAKRGPFWPITCVDCGEEAAPLAWWRRNPRGTRRLLILDGQGTAD
jgi:hypothetical protein